MKPEENHRLAVVIFFSSLGEILLEHFLYRCMLKKNLSADIQERLFPTLTGDKWGDAIKMLNKYSNLDYGGVVKFYKRITYARNKFLHTGYKWVISEDMPKECMRNIQPLLNLFFGLHNRYLVN